jgi:hypothetical protein
MNDEPLARFTSHIEGRNAQVSVYPDRIEWIRPGGVSAGKASAAVLTLGASALVTGVRSKAKTGTEMIPVKSISSVVTERDGFRHTVVRIVASGNTIDFRVSHDEAESVRALIADLVLGKTPTAAAPVAAPPPLPPPPPPSIPAGWHADPHGRHEHRYWDGARWTDHVSDGGVQGTDPA